MAEDGGPAPRGELSGQLGTIDEFVHSVRGERLRREIGRIARPHHIADDVWQDVTLYAWQHWSSFQDEDHVVAACIRKARQRVIDHLRAVGPRRIELCDSFPDDALGAASDPQDLVVRHEDRRARWAALDRLPAKYRTLLLDHAQAGEQYDVLAARRGVTADTLRVQVFRARRALRRAFVSGPAASVAVALAAASAIGRVGRPIRRAVANLVQPTTVAGRVVMGVTVMSTAMVVSPTRLDLRRPAYGDSLATYADTDAPRRQTVLSVPAASTAQPADHPRLATVPAGVLPEIRPPAHEQTCVSDLACLRPDDGPRDTDDPNRPDGEEVCVKAVDRCVSQRKVGGVCPYFANVPREAATCERYSETEHNLPPPPGPVPSSPPAPAPGGPP